MLRVQLCSFFLSSLWLLNSIITPTLGDCWYGNEFHQEGTEVLTAEPCLNCTCNRGTLLCYLRICPKLPNPPPTGCILLHKYKKCCPELICSDVFYNGNGLEARSEPDGAELIDRSNLDHACIVNGSIYGPGSAMDSSTLCEYCYCLGGKQTCVKPKCLLPIDGCLPIYEDNNCCPIYYNCTYQNSFITTTSVSTSSSTYSSSTTRKPITGGCMVDGVYYEEGGKVLGVGHSVCDNCYCLRGILRCEPLSCAPPLLGCSPVIKQGECCAASYNCNGSIEIQPEPNYGQYPTVSKEYAKLRKEVQMITTTTTTTTTNQQNSVTENLNKPFYVIAESQQKLQRYPTTFGTTRHFNGNPFDSSTVTTIGTNSDKLKTTDFDFTDDTLLSIVDSLLDNRLNRRVENGKNTEIVTIADTTTETTTSDFTTTPTTTIEAFNENETETTSTILTTETSSSEEPITVKTVLNSTDCINSNDYYIEKRQDFDITTILSIDANEINKLEEIQNLDDLSIESSESSSSSLSFETTETILDNFTKNIDNRIKNSGATVRSIPKVPIEIEAILNRTKNKDNDYEYDYNEPSLPPSLPNLRIIPFVAADALDSDKDKHNTIYNPQERISTFSGVGGNSGSYTNLFSPPIETEGGFIPKEPPILESFYENAVTAPSISNDPKLHDGCLIDGHEVMHGDIVPSESPCMSCNCFYGNIICQKSPCPNPRPGCRKSSVQNLSLCCPHYICDDVEAPTVVLDRLDGNFSQDIVTIATGINTPDPFRDVIRTEPPPDLQSLIVDMVPYLARKTTPLPPSSPLTTNQIVKNLTNTDNLQIITTTTTTETIEDTTYQDSDERFSFDKVFELLFSQKTNEKYGTTKIKPTQSYTETITAPSSIEKSKQTSPSGDNRNSNNNKTNQRGNSNNLNSVDSTIPGILKLAGCNIYGRMYRVGRIISELSNPCLECKCTEIGVQCRDLSC